MQTLRVSNVIEHARRRRRCRPQYSYVSVYGILLPTRALGYSFNRGQQMLQKRSGDKAEVPCPQQHHASASYAYWPMTLGTNHTAGGQTGIGRKDATPCMASASTLGSVPSPALCLTRSRVRTSGPSAGLGWSKLSCDCNVHVQVKGVRLFACITGAVEAWHAAWAIHK